MDFDPALSFSGNLARFREEAERVDAECAHILFEHLELLLRNGGATRTREAVQEFNLAVFATLQGLPERHSDE